MSNQTAAPRPTWSLSIAEGDYLSVPQGSLTRSGQEGEVISDPNNNEGVTLDFSCDVFGDPDGLPTQEFWYWHELEPTGN